MVSDRSRVDRPVAPPAAGYDTNVPRTRRVPGVPAAAAPTTAQVIRRTDASISRPMYAALGVALHHFTELLDGTIDPLELHRATALLTRQACEILDDEDDALAAIRRLVTDPERVALPDGRRAAELCRETWDHVRDVAMLRATASCEGAEEFGHDSIVNLAAVRGVGAVEPWWGTPTWRRQVELVPDDTVGCDERELLLDQPELAPDDLLSMALGDVRSTRRDPHVNGPTEAIQRAGRDVSEPLLGERAVLTR